MANVKNKIKIKEVQWDFKKYSLATMQRVEWKWGGSSNQRGSGRGGQTQGDKGCRSQRKNG